MSVDLNLDLNLGLHLNLLAPQRLKEEGVCRLIGMTGYPLDLQQEIISRSSIALQTSLTYCHYTLSDTSVLASGFIEFCEKKGIALINAAPIAMGLHTLASPPGWHPAKPETKALCAKAAKYCMQENVDICKLALHFSMSHERLPSTLISCTSLQELAANVRAATEPLSAHEQQVLAYLVDKIFKPAGPQTWHGVELQAYWTSVGKALLTQRLYDGGAQNGSSAGQGDSMGARYGSSAARKLVPTVVDSDFSIAVGMALLLVGIAVLVAACMGYNDYERLVVLLGPSPPPPPPPPSKFLGLF